MFDFLLKVSWKWCAHTEATLSVKNKIHCTLRVTKSLYRSFSKLNFVCPPTPGGGGWILAHLWGSLHPVLGVDPISLTCTTYAVVTFSLTYPKQQSRQGGVFQDSWESQRKREKKLQQYTPVVRPQFQQQKLRVSQYGLLASFGRFSCTFSLFVPIWNPFMLWIALWAERALS